MSVVSRDPIEREGSSQCGSRGVVPVRAKCVGRTPVLSFPKSTLFLSVIMDSVLDATSLANATYNSAPHAAEPAPSRLPAHGAAQCASDVQHGSDRSSQAVANDNLPNEPSNTQQLNSPYGQLHAQTNHPTTGQCTRILLPLGNAGNGLLFAVRHRICVRSTALTHLREKLIQRIMGRGVSVYLGDSHTGSHTGAIDQPIIGRASRSQDHVETQSMPMRRWSLHKEFP